MAESLHPMDRVKGRPIFDTHSFKKHSIYSVINHINVRHSRESGDPGQHWIPGQARNDKLHKTYVVVYN
jgi:hypothetical protein